MKRHMIINLLGLLIFIALLAGCNKEKAEAVKLAAEKLRVEAISAIEKINGLFTQSITMPAAHTDEIDRIVRDIEKENINAEKLSFLMNEAETGRGTAEKVNDEFEKIKQGYYQFEGMFRSLPKGSYFAGKAVKKAEKHAIQLTVQMLNFAEYLQKYPVQFTGKRTLLIERINEAKKLQDQNLRKERLSIISREILQLKGEEQKAKQEAILQCLKAAETGKLVAELIRNYNSLSIEELLGSIRNTLNFIAEISSNQDVVSLLERYKSVETAIKNDPYWNAILSGKVM
jgi:hypothetical protein